jgi:hypothetical protein
MTGETHIGQRVGEIACPYHQIETKRDTNLVIAMIGLGLTVFLNIATTIWWASNIETRVENIEDTRNTQEEGAERDVRIDFLFDLQKDNVAAHARQNEALQKINDSQTLKFERMMDRMQAIAEDVAAIRGPHIDKGHPNASQR